MKIVYLVDEFPPFFRGGLGTYAMEISKKLCTHAHKITAFSRNTGNDPVSDHWNGVEVYRPHLMNIKDVLFLLSPHDVQNWAPDDQNFFLETVLYNQLSANYAINKLAKEDKREFDLVVAHDWLAAVAGLLIQRNLNLPFVFHFHSTEHGRTDYGSETVRMIERFSADMADIIVTVSNSMKNELILLGYPEEKIRVIYNAVDPEKYNLDRFSECEIREFREKIGINNSPMIFFVGRLTKVKGVDELVRAMPGIIKEFPDAKLVILGVGEMEKEIRTIIKEKELEDSVILHNKYVNEAERILYYAASDITVFPSKYEPFGIVCTEAMSMKKPVIVGATGTSGLREQIIPEGEEQCGYHINPWQPDDIAKWVNILLANPDNIKKFGENARKRVMSEYNWDIAAKRTAEVYQEAVDKHRSTK